MRLDIYTSPNNEVVPYNYQVALVGAFHKWLGPNELHDESSSYSLSWLNHGRSGPMGLDFPNGAYFHIGLTDPDPLRKLISGMMEQPEIRFGLRVKDAVLRVCPKFGTKHRFILQSPVLIKRTVGEEVKFYFPEDECSDEYLTETLKNKLERAGKDTSGLKVYFDRSYLRIKKKVAEYKGIKNKGTVCPIWVEGKPEALAFAWAAGLGNCTGIGWGAVK